MVRILFAWAEEGEVPTAAEGEGEGIFIQMESVSGRCANPTLSHPPRGHGDVRRRGYTRTRTGSTQSAFRAPRATMGSS